MKRKDSNFAWHVLLIALLAASSFVLAYGPEPAEARKLQRAEANHPVIRLIEQTPVGTSEKRLLRMVKKAGFSFQRVVWKDKGAMARGLVGNPHHLKMLNERGVNHPFFDGLPDKGPTFVVASYAGSRAVYALMDAKVWSLGYGVNLQAQRDLDYDDPDRVGHIRLIFSELARLCADLRVEEADSYGNPRVFACTKGPGGPLYARYDATQLDSLSILVHPIGARTPNVN